MRILRNQRGVALPVAIFALVLIGALVAGTFFVGRVEQQTGRNSMPAAQAAAAAEAGLAEAQAMDPLVFDAIAIYTGDPAQELVFSNALSGQPNMQYTATVRRLNNSLFLIRSDGQRSAAGQVVATQSVGAFSRILKPTFSVHSAVTISDQLVANGNAFEVSGENAAPGGWSNAFCGADSARTDNVDDKVGLRTAGNHGLTSGELDNIEGFPTNAVENDTTVTSQTFQDYLDYNYNMMADMADDDGKTIPHSNSTFSGVGPVVDAGDCDESVLANFGDPWRGLGSVPECYTYFPIVHADGDVKFASGTRGQGTLLVDGNLEISGGFEWSGVVIVRGEFRIQGTGNKITGALLAEGVKNTLGGNVSVQYSQCAVQKAVLGAAEVSPLGQRAWVQLY